LRLKSASSASKNREVIEGLTLSWAFFRLLQQLRPEQSLSRYSVAATRFQVQPAFEGAHLSFY